VEKKTQNEETRLALWASFFSNHCSINYGVQLIMEFLSKNHHMALFSV